MLASELKKSIREIPDFPKPGINFYDVSTLFRNARAFRSGFLPRGHRAGDPEPEG